LVRQARWRQLSARLADDLQDPAAVTGEERQQLAIALDQCSQELGSVQDFRTLRAEARAAVSAWEATTGERDELAQRLGLTAESSAADTAALSEAISRMEAAPAAERALYQPALTDELTRMSLGQERERVSEIASERANLMPELRDGALDTAPEQLELWADTIEQSGFVARLFGGAFKAARHGAQRVLCGDQSDRTAVAGLLRRLARHIRQWESFRSQSPAKALFPGPLWRGIESDWGSLAAAEQGLEAAFAAMSNTRREKSLHQWLELPQRERAALGAAARSVAPSLHTAVTVGLGQLPVREAGERLRQQERRLEAVENALAAVRVREDGFIRRDGENLAARIEGLQASAMEFTSVAARPSFDWVEGIGSSLEPMARALETADAIQGLAGPLPLHARLREAGAPAAALDATIAARDTYLAAVDAWNEAADALGSATGVEAERLVSLGTPWNALADALRALSEDEEGARLAADLLRYRHDLDEIGCGSLARIALDGKAPAETLPDMYELGVTRALLDRYLGGDGAELARLGSLTLETARAAFVRTDRKLHQLEAQLIVATRSNDQAPRGNGVGPRPTWTEMSLLANEVSLKRPRTPLRDVTARAGQALQTLKPVWMMSPTSAAQFIQPGTLHFDLLVVDEASQMRPEFAVSPVMRGAQFVVVGDTNQLPPTDFFAAQEDDGDGAGEDDTVKIDTESILDLANQRFPRRRLRWHYRSQHEQLIQFSNRQFYDRDLIVFPSPTTDDDLLGIRHVYVGGRYEASINEEEAKAVIQEAYRLMRAYPEKSIGIAAMNAKQSELIRNEFDRIVLEAPEVRDYVAAFEGSIDEFFIKNLENVQGDERDIILVSTVYGPDKSGNVAQRFGPMNREVGWRRLNVLVTRAKLSTRIFTSLRPSDIKVTETSSRGLIAFQAYLTYAANQAQYDNAEGGEPDSDFEIFVADAVRGAGYEVVPQIGVEGFRIDLGIRHPDYPVGFIAGIECDGATYHSGMTVRDRDHIRQTVLEGMGWNIYRIWSTDWFANPARETAKLLAELERNRDELARLYKSRPQAPDPAQGAFEAVETTPVEADRSSATTVVADTQDDEEPTGRAMRSIDGIEWFEVRAGQLYSVWAPGDAGSEELKLAGHVRVLSRASSAPQLYGGQTRVAKSEYEGSVERTGERFIQHDIYAAVREVARRASCAPACEPNLVVQ
jgi:very-short-patch-repair endonuclease